MRSGAGASGGGPSLPGRWGREAAPLILYRKEMIEGRVSVLRRGYQPAWRSVGSSRIA